MPLPVGLEIRAEGFEPLVERLALSSSRLQNLAPALNITANLLEAHVSNVWATRGAAAGKAWQRLAPRTVKARENRRGYYGRRSPKGAGAEGPILRWSGRLERSFKRGGVAHLRHVSASSLRWGSGVRYGVFHDSPEPRSHLPRRAILAFKSQMQRREILFQPIRLWAQGVPPGAIATTLQGRLRLGPVAFI